MGNKSAPEPGTLHRTRSDFTDHNQFKADLHTLHVHSKSERNLTEKFLEQCYQKNEIPDEMEITGETTEAQIRVLRGASKSKCDQCNCKQFKNIKNLHASDLSSEDMAHIATQHKTFTPYTVYRSLKMSKQRSQRYLRLDLTEKPKRKQQSSTNALNALHTKKAKLISKSMQNVHDLEPVLWSEIQSRGRAGSAMCASSSTCKMFITMCKAYQNLNKPPKRDSSHTFNYQHCVEFHVDDYPLQQCEGTCEVESDSTDWKHIIHGHWFHRFPLHKLHDEFKEIELRQKSTDAPRYVPLSMSNIPSPLEIGFTASAQSFSLSESYEGDCGDGAESNANSFKLNRFKSLKNALSEKPMSKQYTELQFGAPFEVKKEDAVFKDPKQEILNNEYKHLTKAEWNDLLKKSLFYVKVREARVNKLAVKEIVALKLYTDYDALQNHYRKCFRKGETDRQRQFFWWNKMLEIACAKSKDIVTKKIFHGVSAKLTLSTFSGTYYGPVSTTTLFEVAKSFAGANGKILELYPSFGRRGLKVSFLSNFPDEDEILWMNTSFQIHDVYDTKATTPRKSMIGGLNATNETQSYQFEQAVVQAIQSINIESKVISLNVSNKYWVHSMQNETKEDDISGFIELSSRSQLAVLYLLYLQYRKKEWDDFVEKTSQIVKNALEKFRAEFVLLAENVKAVKMERLSIPLQMFFYIPQKDYTFPIDWFHGDRYSRNDRSKYFNQFQKNQPFRFDTIARLFPKAEQISINAQNWDFSLNTFINFLAKFDMDYADIKLQDIFIKFHDKTSSEIVIDNAKAQRRMRKAMEAQNLNGSKQLSKLRKLGWTFVNNSRLHRVSCEPAPELPFVMAFCKPRSNTRFFYRSYSMQLTSQQIQEINTFNDEVPGGHNHDQPENALQLERKTEQEVDEEVDEGSQQRYVVLKHNPANCVLSQQMFDILTYKDTLASFLQYSKCGGYPDEKRKYKYWLSLCKKVETLVLDPMPDVLKQIFMEYPNNQPRRSIISFKTVFKLFGNVQELFLRNTILNLRICYKFIEFVKECGRESVKLPLERVFFNKPKHNKHIPDRHIVRFNLVLNPYSWKINIFEHCVQRFNST